MKRLIANYIFAILVSGGTSSLAFSAQEKSFCDVRTPDSYFNLNIVLQLHDRYNSRFGEESAKHLTYENLLFSPDGRFLAFTVSNIHTGDPEYAYIIDLLTCRSRLATNKFQGKDTKVVQFSWNTNDSLEIHMWTSQALLDTQ